MAGWTDERVDLLKKLWAQGLSASQIARRLGGFEHTTDGGRLAVCGKANRLGLSRAMGSRSGTAKKRTASARRARQEGPTPNRNTGIFAARAVKLDAEPHVPLGPDIVIPTSERRTLQQLCQGDCRWPFGDPRQADFHFCGKPQVPGLPYCEFHARRAFVSVPGRARGRKALRVNNGPGVSPDFVERELGVKISEDA